MPDTERWIMQHYSCQWEFIPIGIRTIPIPRYVVRFSSHCHSYCRFYFYSFFLAPMRSPWGSYYRREFHSHGHLVPTPPEIILSYFATEPNSVTYIRLGV